MDVPERGRMDRELQFWLAITRRLPAVRGAGFIANCLKSIYLRTGRPQTEAVVLGFRMRLNPVDCVYGGLLFYPHILDRHERRFLEENLKPGDVFLDAGAHVGLFSLIASRCVGGQGRVISFEANPETHRKLSEHLAINEISNVLPVQQGLSDARSTLRLGVSSTGSLAGASFLSGSPSGVMVECDTLHRSLAAHGIRKVHGAKFDIEGFEYRVLKKYFEESPGPDRPDFLIIEHNPEWIEKAGGDVTQLLTASGYRGRRVSNLNYIFVRA